MSKGALECLWFTSQIVFYIDILMELSKEGIPDEGNQIKHGERKDLEENDQGSV